MADEQKPAEKTTETEAKPQGSVAIPPKGKTNNKTLLIIIGVIVFLFVILPMLIFTVFALWLGSGDNAKNLVEKSIESSTGADIDTDNGSISVKNNDGDEMSFGGDQDYADDFPSEVPKYPNGTVTSNVRTTNDSGDIYWSNYVTTSDSTKEVSAYFDEQMSEWTETSTYTVNDSTTTSYEKGNLDAVITVSKTDEGTAITYNVTQKK